jgi:hypothetical protein
MIEDLGQPEESCMMFPRDDFNGGHADPNPHTAPRNLVAAMGLTGLVLLTPVARLSLLLVPQPMAMVTET